MSKSPDFFAGMSIDENPLIKTFPSKTFTRFASISADMILSGIFRPVSIFDLRGIGYPLSTTGFLNRSNQTLAIRRLEVFLNCLNDKINSEKDTPRFLRGELPDIRLTESHSSLEWRGAEGSP